MHKGNTQSPIVLKIPFVSLPMYLTHTKAAPMPGRLCSYIFLQQSPLGPSQFPPTLLPSSNSLTRASVPGLIRKPPAYNRVGSKESQMEQGREFHFEGEREVGRKKSGNTYRLIIFILMWNQFDIHLFRFR